VRLDAADTGNAAPVRGIAAALLTGLVGIVWLDVQRWRPVSPSRC